MKKKYLKSFFRNAIGFDDTFTSLKTLLKPIERTELSEIEKKEVLEKLEISLENTELIPVVNQPPADLRIFDMGVPMEIINNPLPNFDMGVIKLPTTVDESKIVIRELEAIVEKQEAGVSDAEIEKEYGYLPDNALDDLVAVKDALADSQGISPYEVDEILNAEDGIVAVEEEKNRTILYAGIALGAAGLLTLSYFKFVKKSF